MNGTAKYGKCAVYIMIFALLIAFPLTAHSKDTIRIGNPIALSGVNVAGAMMSQIRAYDLWVEEVNAEGGIYVKEYGKKLPVEIIRYDDKSDVGTTVKLTEKLLLEDKVDFILPPWGTASHFAIAPLVTKYKSPVIGITASSIKLKELAPKTPYLFILLNQPDVQGQALVDICVELGVKSAAVIHHTDLHGIECAGAVLPQLAVSGIDVALYKSFPFMAKDLSPLLKKVKAANVDALIGFSYPPETFLMTGQMIAIGLNPKLFYTTVGVAYPSYRDEFGAKTVEGIMGAGCWNPKLPYPGVKEWYDRYVKRWGIEPDRWGTAGGYATVQIMQKAIEIAGTLDPIKVRDVIASEKFDTALGPTKFENQFNISYPGHVGQWRDGEFLVADKATRQAEPLYPKPAWPEK